MTRLVVIPTTHVDRAWADGASCLKEACDLVDEITGDQLKLLCSRGERILVCMLDGEEKVGWGTFRVDQLPNMRVMFVTDLVAHNSHFERFYDELKLMADSLGCSRIRCAAQPAQARLYRMQLGFEPVYQILEKEI